MRRKSNNKVLFLLMLVGLSINQLNAQRGNLRIGYIDTEYILENVPDYQDASAQLNQKLEQWKLEIDGKLKAIELKKSQLENESVLLTKELYDERFEDITFEEAEILDYQQKRFGPNGDLVLQKKQLMQPIQDQIYAAVQDIAEKRKYDFIFDKSSDFLMLYSAERYDISDIVLRTITRASRRQQADTPAERKALREEEAIDNKSFEEIEREEKLEAQQTKRDSLLADRRAQREADLAERKRLQQEARDAKRQEAEARRQKALEARNAKSANTVTSDSTGVKTSSSSTIPPGVNAVKTDSTASKATTPKTAAQIQEERRQQKLKEREERRKALEERKKKILEERQKAREERENKAKKADSIAKAKKEENKENEN